MHAHSMACVAAATLLLLTGCATSHDVVALTGTVESVREADASAPYRIYKIRRLDDRMVEVPAFASVVPGTCVDVLVAATKSASRPQWTARDVTLRQTNACPAPQREA